MEVAVWLVSTCETGSQMLTSALCKLGSRRGFVSKHLRGSFARALRRMRSQDVRSAPLLLGFLRPARPSALWQPCWDYRILFHPPGSSDGVSGSFSLTLRFASRPRSLASGSPQPAEVWLSFGSRSALVRLPLFLLQPPRNKTNVM